MLNERLEIGVLNLAEGGILHRLAIIQHRIRYWCTTLARKSSALLVLSNNQRVGFPIQGNIVVQEVANQVIAFPKLLVIRLPNLSLSSILRESLHHARSTRMELFQNLIHEVTGNTLGTRTIQSDGQGILGKATFDLNDLTALIVTLHADLLSTEEIFHQAQEIHRSLLEQSRIRLLSNILGNQLRDQLARRAI